MSSKAGRRAREKRETKQGRRAAAAGLLAIGTGGPLGAAVIVTPPADAASFSVTNNNDSGPGSLRAAVAAADAAAGADTVSIGTTGVITLTTGEIEITDDVTIAGPGAAQLTVNAGGQSRVFNVHPATPTDTDAVVISGLTLTGGAAPSYYSSYYHTTYQEAGGAITALGGYDSGTSTWSGSLTLDHVVITNSDAASGGAVRSVGTHLHLSNAALSGNTAQYGGGAVSALGRSDVTDSTINGNSAARGGGLSARQLTMEGSVISGNASSSSGGGLHLYGLYGGSTVSDTLISGNTAGGRGGGAYSFDGYGPVAFDNATIVGNSAVSQAGGLFSGAGTTVTGSTISGNTAQRGGGAYAVGNGPTLQDSIVANNSAATTSDNDLATGNTYYGDSIKLDYSLVESTPATGTITDVTAGSNIIGQDPQLTSLADNGGLTQTMKPANTSPVVDKGKAFGLTTDQRGSARPVDLGSVSNAAGGDGADMGAVELVSVAEGNVVQNTALPTIGGSPVVGSTLAETSPGSWTPGGVSFTRQWLRDGADIPGATGTSYLLGSADLNRHISLRVTASTTGYTSASATSAPTAAVTSPAPPPPPPPAAPGTLVTSGTPVIKGKLAVGNRLTAVPPSCTPAATVTYQWLRSGKVISTATKAKYKLRRADKGKKISVRVTFAQAGYSTKVITIKRAGKVK